MRSVASLLILLVIIQIVFMICMFALAIDINSFKRKIETSKKINPAHTCNKCAYSKELTRLYCKRLNCYLPSFTSDILGCGSYKDDETDE